MLSEFIKQLQFLTKRQLAIGAAVLIFSGIRLIGIVASLLMRGKPGAPVPLWIPVGTWVIPLLASLISLDAIFNGPFTRGFAAARRATLGWKLRG